jgi:hypothetical protein
MLHGNPPQFLTGFFMPLPNAPTRKHQNSPQNNGKPAISNELLFKGILCTLIGLGVLLSPRFITSPGMQGIVANSSWVGWFALVLGIAFTGLYVRRRLTG